MPSPRKTAKGTWAIQIDVAGQRPSSTHATKSQAIAWAAAKTLELKLQASGQAGTVKTLGDALKRYALEVSPNHRGWRWEIVRLTAYQKPGSSLPVHTRLSDLTTAHMAAWRDARLLATSRGTVLRDIGLLSAVFQVARLEWDWLQVNPLTNMRKPSAPAHRDVLITGLQTRKILRALGYEPGMNRVCFGVYPETGRDTHKVHIKPIKSVSQAVAVCFLTALATGMRSGELCGLTWANVYATHCVLPMTKNGQRRDVPLSKVATRLIERMRGFDPNLVFGVGVESKDSLFRRARGRAGLTGINFHDARHTAATRIAPLVDVLTLCKIFGWSNTSQALVYFNMPASKIATMLN